MSQGRKPKEQRPAGGRVLLSLVIAIGAVALGFWLLERLVDATQ